MPPWGLDGGGPLNVQQVDDLLNYLETFQVSQTEALVNIEGNVSGALARLDSADDAVANQISAQEEMIASVEFAPTLLPIAEALARDAAKELRLAGEGLDTDGDGLSDSAEQALTELGTLAVAAELVDQAPTLDPTNIESSIGTADGRAARTLVSQVEARAAELDLIVSSADSISAQADVGLAALQEAAGAQRWAVDFPVMAALSFGGNLDDARRAVGLFNGYCARCHTAGYTAGTAFQQQQAAGGFGPSLRDGRANTQFLVTADMVDFLITGSENGIGYGANGVGSGRMPGFGTVLSQRDIDLIVQYLRGPTLDGMDIEGEEG